MSDMRADLDAVMTDMVGDEEEVREEILESSPVEEITNDEPLETASEETPTPDETPSETPIEVQTDTPTDTKIDKSKNLKAPTGWTPKERENWSKVPPELQQRITAREQEMTEVMANTKTSRQIHQRMNSMAQQYGAVMAAEGVKNPIQATENMFKTVAQLRMGTAAQKANTMAQMIQHYGIDIGDLDNALVGKAPPQGQQPQADAVQQAVQAQLAPIMQQYQQQQQNAAQGKRNQAIQEVQTFSDSAEFLQDVRHDMADLIDIAAKHGRPMPIQEAYDKACALNPEIAQVINERKQNESIMGGNSVMGNKRRASASLNGRQSGVAGHNGGVNRRSDLMQAWDDASG
jgi:hypothetical protein